MKFCFDASFRYCLKRYHHPEIIDIKRKLDAFIRAYDAGEIPIGFGLKKLKKNLWEIRVNLPQRILFWKNPADITFTFVGNHNEIHRFIKQI